MVLSPSAIEQFTFAECELYLSHVSFAYDCLLSDLHQEGASPTTVLNTVQALRTLRATRILLSDRWLELSSEA